MDNTVARKEYLDAMTHITKSLVMTRQCIEFLTDWSKTEAQDIDLLKDSMLKVLDFISDLEHRVSELERTHAVYEFTRIA